MDKQTCHGCQHPVEAHTDFEGCTYRDKATRICWCHFTPAWAARRAAEAGRDGGEG